MKVYSIFKSVTDDAATKNPAWAAFLIARQSSSEYSTLKAPKALLHFRTFLCTFFSTILSAETRRGCPERHSSEHNFALGTIQMPSFSVAVRLDVLHHDKASRNTEASHGRGTERPPRRQAALQGGVRPGRPAASPNSQRGFSPLDADVSTASTTVT